jgi:4-hydroxy-tetrahydrodipicolinate reductase
VTDQLELCIRAGANVASSTEELLFPYDRHPELSARIDGLARNHGVTVLGTGVNPGYVMDSLALMATGVCREVRRMKIERVVDASRRRLPLQRKVGAGLTPEAFEQRKRAGAFGHIGLRESLLLVAAGLGWPLERVEERLDPVIADGEVETPHLRVRAGQVAGIHHTVRGYRNGDEAIALDLKMYVGATEPRDAIRVDGDPPIDLVIRGGVFGDTATVATLINAVPAVVSAEPGLTTVMDLPLPRALPPSASGAPSRPTEAGTR